MITASLAQLLVFLLGAWSTPRTWVPGELITAGIMNAHVRDQLNILKVPINDSGQIELADGGELTLVAGVVTITHNLHTIDTESDDATDDVDTLTPGTDVAPGFITWVRPASATRTIVLKDSTDNMSLGHDVTLDISSSAYALVWTGTVWKPFTKTPLSLRAVQVYTADDTWTKPEGLQYVLVWIVGGGGGGGGATGDYRNGGGGAGGGGSFERIDASDLGANETVTIGAAGAAGATGNNAGGTGGTTSLGALISATGGTGGVGSSTTNTRAAGGTGTGGDLNIAGQDGGPSRDVTSTDGPGPGVSHGGSPPFGWGHGSFGYYNLETQADGLDASGHGGGGSGGNDRGAGTAAGGAGTVGAMMIWEFGN